MQLNRKGLWSSCNSYEHNPVPYKRYTLLLMKSQAIVVIKEKFSFQLKKQTVAMSLVCKHFGV